jgi:predicted nucleic acid-binding protein
LANEAETDKRVLDVNMLAVFLVEDHPGHQYVAPIVEEGLIGAYVPLILDVLPLRAYWVMTRRWGCRERESAQAIRYFLNEYERPQYPSLRKLTIEKSFRLAEELKHDVFDCAYLALALQEEATSIITTDTDFERLCKRQGLEYHNPVPANMLKRFKQWTQQA